MRKCEMSNERKAINMEQNMTVDEWQRPDCEESYVSHKDCGLQYILSRMALFMCLKQVNSIVTFTC